MIVVELLLDESYAERIQLELLGAGDRIAATELLDGSAWHDYSHLRWEVDQRTAGESAGDLGL